MNLVVRCLGRTQYDSVWDGMKAFTDRRDASTDDELWITEHNPVFTLGQAAKPEHLLATEDIQVVQSDRGGQVTYHGPGQIVAYLLRDLRRAGQGVHEFVRGLEQCMIRTLKSFEIVGVQMHDNPGVYVEGRKIGAIGLRIRKGCSYHGISLNVAMDLSPFGLINPCGLVGMQVAQISDFVPNVDYDDTIDRFVKIVSEVFEYGSVFLEGENARSHLHASIGRESRHCALVGSDQ